MRTSRRSEVNYRVSMMGSQRRRRIMERGGGCVLWGILRKIENLAQYITAIYNSGIKQNIALL